MARWRVDIIRRKTEHLGIVTAPNAQEALNRAASLFRVEPSRYNKLMIKKIEEREPADHSSISGQRLYRKWLPTSQSVLALSRSTSSANLARHSGGPFLLV